MLKYVLIGIGLFAFIMTIPLLMFLPSERVILGAFNPAEACLVSSVLVLSAGLTLHAMSINPGRGTLESVVKKYGDDWFRSHRVTRGIGLALGGLSHIAADVLGDEMESMGGQKPNRTWSTNDILGKLGLRPIAHGDVALVTAIAEKKMEGPHLVWTMRLTLFNTESADLFAKAVEEQTRQ